MAVRNGGQLIVDYLKSYGATKAFGVPGESYLPILDALHDTRGELDFVTCRHEGGASFMASAWGKLRGEPGICLVTRGPGATNASIGVHASKQDSVPMILLIGQVTTEHLGREAFQEVDYTPTFSDLAKLVLHIDHVSKIPEIMETAWRTAMGSRPGPVVVVLPEEVLTEEIDAEIPCVAPTVQAPSLNDKFKETFGSCIADSKQPLIVLGPGINEDAKLDFQQFSEANRVPVICAFRSHDSYDNHSSTFIGEAGVGMPAHVAETIEKCDFMLAVGVRFGEMLTGAYEILKPPKLDKTLIHVHPSLNELGKIFAADYIFEATPTSVASTIGDMQLGLNFSEWCDARRASHLHFLKNLPPRGPVDMVEVTSHLQSVLPNDSVVTNGAGNFAFWPNKMFQYGRKQRLLAPISGAMGYGVPAAVAAKISDPSKVVICFAGDGDFQMTSAELATARQHSACPIILIINNGRYGTIRMHQERAFPGRISGTECWNPDFVALGASYGFHSERVENTDQFVDAFDRALHSATGAILELLVDGQ